MTEWFTIIIITIFAVISPGPDFAMVSRNSLILSRRAGLLTAFGIGMGVQVHVAYTLLGVGLLIQTSPMLFSLLKVVGAGYLIWLGSKMLVAKVADEEITTPKAAVSDLEALRVGFFTNALNPKTTIFIVSLFMQVVQESTPMLMQVAYGLFISAAHIFWFGLVALFFASPHVRAKVLGMRQWLDRIFGGILIAFGLGLAMGSLAS
ncbi:LysE family transporter [Paracoccaceae bacterium]